MHPMEGSERYKCGLFYYNTSITDQLQLNARIFCCTSQQRLLLGAERAKSQLVLARVKLDFETRLKDKKKIEPFLPFSKINFIIYILKMQ